MLNLFMLTIKKLECPLYDVSLPQMDGQRTLLSPIEVPTL